MDTAQDPAGQLPARTAVSADGPEAALIRHSLPSAQADKCDDCRA